MTTTACLPECERNCWTGQDKHAFGCPVAAMFGAAEQAYFGPRAPQAEAPKCDCGAQEQNDRILARTGPGEGMRLIPCALNCSFRLFEETRRKPAPQAEDGGKVGRKVCQKIPHSAGGGYMHDEEHDGPYDVDGVLYCGRCHSWYNNPADHGAPALSEQPRTAAGNVDLWDKHQAVRLNLQKEVWASQAVARDLEAERDALRAEVGTWREQYEAETRSLQNLVAFALEPITPNYEKPMQGEHNVVRDTLARLFGFEILATQQIDALRAEVLDLKRKIEVLESDRGRGANPDPRP